MFRLRRHSPIPAWSSCLVMMALISLCSTRGLVNAQEVGALSPRNANYAIEARLDPEAKTIEAKEVLRWRNITQSPADELWFHLYYNAWKNDRSTWLREDAWPKADEDDSARDLDQLREEDWSYCRIDSIKVLAVDPFEAEDLTASMSYEAPDDGNLDDQTVMKVPLARAVQPGETIELEITWKLKIPRTFARTGYRGDYFFLAQWFPKIGVFEAGGTWNCHQFHRGTEFFADYGVYDAKLTVPSGWLVGSTGVEQKVTDNKDGTSTHHYVQADVHDFAWTTSPDFEVEEREWSFPGLAPVKLRFLYQSSHRSQVDRHFQATQWALQYYGSWYGEYPYGHITFIDPAWESGSGGMEYPTLFTCGTRIFNPQGGSRPEAVTVHEAGHQFWYGLVGNNEFENAWLDEGFNRFSDIRALNIAHGESKYVARYVHDIFAVMNDEMLIPRMTGGTGGITRGRYQNSARWDAMATPTYRYHPSTHAGLSYSKTTLWLSMLEREYGWETLRRILSTYFHRYEFKHPTPDDFFAVAEEVVGPEIETFFDQVFRQSVLFDYSVEAVASSEVETRGFIDQGGKLIYNEGDGAEDKIYETQVIIRRLQDGRLPVDVLLVFENGDEIREAWDAQKEWKRITAVKPAKLKYAEVDPDRKNLLDLNFTNNSMLLEPRADLPATKWASKWMIWLQDFMESMSYLF